MYYVVSHSVYISFTLINMNLVSLKLVFEFAVLRPQSSPFKHHFDILSNLPLRSAQVVVFCKISMVGSVDQKYVNRELTFIDLMKEDS